MITDSAHRLPHGDLMVVEDNPSDLRLLSDILTEAGYRVRAASDGELALRSVQAKLPDLILLDIKMPGVGGVEVCRRLKSDPETRDVPIIFISALGQAELKVKAIEAGGIDYITKPLESSEVLARINTHLNMYRLQRKLAVQTEELIAEIEERKQVEKSLRESEERYRVVADDTPILICRFLPGGELTYVNAAYSTYFGKTPGELVGSSFLELIPEADRENVMANLGALTIDCPNRSNEHQVLAPRGEIRWQRWTNRALFDAQGRPIGYQSIGEDITERKRAEEELSESEEKFRSISASAQDAIIMIDADGSISYWNEAATTVFGYTRDEVIGKQLHSAGLIVPEQYRGAHYQAWPEFHKTGKGSVVGNTVEVVALKKNGDEFPIEFSLSGVKIKGQWHGIGILRDITERKNAEAKLRKLSVAVEQSPASIVITDTHGTIEYVNPMFCKVTGYTAEEAIGQNPRILKSGEWPKEAYEILWKTINAGEMWTGEFHNKKKSGELYWEGASICPIRDGDGVITHFLGVKQDITRSKWAEWQLQEAKRRVEEAHAELQKTHLEISRLFEAISSVVIGVNQVGRITAWNGAAQSTFGVDREKAMGRLLSSLEMGWDETAVARGIAKCRTEKRSVRIDEVRFKRPNDTEGFLGITLNPLSVGAGENLGFLLVAADITEHRVLQGQLVQAQKLESIGQLAAGIAHEINTPIQYVGDNVRFFSDSMDDLLALVGSYHELVSEMAKGASAEECVERAATLEQEADLEYLKDELPKSIAQSLVGVGRVSKIVRSMKDFSHPGAEGKEAADLNQAIESTITVARNEWKYVAEMVTEFDPALPPVPCLVGEFNQVILNIVINAAHAIADVVGKDTGDKGIITIKTRQVGDWAEIRISDTGTGICEAHRSKIFDHFFTTKEVGKGTGQGLAIARAVVTEKHNGTITLESEMGNGTTFIIRLPIVDQGAKETPQHEAAHSLR